MQCSRKRLQVKPRKRQKDLPVGWRENQRRCYQTIRTESLSQPTITTDKFAIARAVLLLCLSRSPKSCSVHVEKVIVFSFCFCSFAFIMSSSSILGDCTLETLPGKCSPLLHCTTTMLACSACCLRCWQLYRADVEAKKADVEAKKADVEAKKAVVEAKKKKNGGINKG
jgi:hypothetical protein